jgi:NADPH2:quinone reductase
MMQAMVLEAFGGVENFRWKEWPFPEPKAGEVRIRIQAVSVNPVDYKMRQGLIPIQLPEVLGRDVAGTVDAVGTGVTAFKPGDEVIAVLFGPRSNGAYAEYVTTPTAFVNRKPAKLSYPQAATLGVAGITAYTAVKLKGQVEPGESVFVAGGAGGVGSFAIPLLKASGAKSIVATAGSDESARYLVDTLGIDPNLIIRYPGLSLEQMESRFRDLTADQNVAVAFDFVGGDMKKLCFLTTGFDGRVVSIVEEPPEFNFNIWQSEGPLFAKSGTYHFVAMSARARNGGPEDWYPYRELLEELSKILETGDLAPPKVTELGRLSEKSIREAHTRLENGHVKGKLALMVS